MQFSYDAHNVYIYIYIYLLLAYERKITLFCIDFYRKIKKSLETYWLE